MTTKMVMGHLDEIFLHVKDLEKMRAFYVGVLGFEEDFYHEGNMLGLRTGGPALVLKASEQGAKGVWLGLSCTGIEGLIDEITAKGVTITKPLWEGHWGARVVEFEDPEGNTVFFEEPAEPTGHDH